MKLSRALSDLVKYTCSVGLYDIEAQGKTFSSRSLKPKKTLWNFTSVPLLVSVNQTHSVESESFL